MTWQMYRWVWQLRSPLHVGYGPAGALNRTRLYIPARNMWAALTAEIAREQAGGAFPLYKDVGRELQEHVRFSYLFPAEQMNGRWFVWLPHYEEEKGLLWYREDREDEPDQRFLRRLLYTRPSTAIAPGSDTAEEGSLREVECIATHWKPEQGQTLPSPVAFVGYVYLKDSLPQDLQSALKDVREIFIGGETRYGFGHLVLLPFSSQEPWEKDEACFGYEVGLDSDTPVVKQPSYLVAHGIFSLDNAKGDRELLFQWDWQTPRPGHQLYWKPGTQVQEAQKFVFAINSDGFWEGRQENS